MKNSDIVYAWRGNKAARGGTLWTNGSSIYSYGLLIGWTTPKGVKVANDYTAPSGNFRSQTTSCHVNLVKRVATEVMVPHAAELILG